MFSQKRNGTRKVFDSHIHVGFCKGVVAKKEDDFFLPIEEVINYLNQNRIGRALIFPFPNPEISSFEANRYIIQCIENAKTRLYGLLYFSGKEDPRELLNFVHSNIVGIKVHPPFSKKSFAELAEPLLKIVRDNNWIILTDSSISVFGHPSHIVKFARNNPDIRIVCGHMARLFHQEILEIPKLDNVWLDISGICLLSENSYRLAPPVLRHSSLRETLSPQRILEYLLCSVGRKKIIWGSDFPFPQIFGGKLAQEIDFAFEKTCSFLDEETIQDLLNNNIESLIGK